MTREEAAAECARLAVEHPERRSYRWFPRDSGGDGGWVVARVAIPPGTRVDPLKETIETKPKPPTPADPRTAFEQNAGGYAGA